MILYITANGTKNKKFKDYEMWPNTFVHILYILYMHKTFFHNRITYCQLLLNGIGSTVKWKI